MSFTASDVILDVRDMISDSLAPTRYTDAFILRKINQVLLRMVVLRPDLFTDIATITTVTGSLQRAPADSARLMDVSSNSLGASVKEVNQDVLDMTLPTWETLPPGPATNWMRYPRDQNRFYVFPASSGGEQLEVIYAKTPRVANVGDVVPLQDAYMSALVDGTVWIMEAVDAEHVESQKAAMFYEVFKEQLAGGLTARRITDTNEAAKPKDEVV